MQTVLNQFNAVPGVLGSLICDTDGKLLGQAFPEEVPAAALQGAASALSDKVPALESALGSASMLDFRYANARIAVKGLKGARVLFLCSPSVNLELLGMAVSGAARKVEKLVAARGGPRLSAAGGGSLYRTVERINAIIERSGGDPFKLRGQIALKAGFALDLIDPGTPDDPIMLQRLRAAASAVLEVPV
jgi:predicted regulator of Ras-like GTPase activity (Roadblock/LC7/MglB family)